MAATLDSERRRWQAKGYAIALEREGYVLLVKPKRLGGQRAVILEVDAAGNVHRGDRRRLWEVLGDRLRGVR